MNLNYQELLWEGNNYFNEIPVLTEDDVTFEVGPPTESRYATPTEVALYVDVTMNEELHTKIVGLICEHVSWHARDYDKSPFYKATYIIKKWPQLRGVKRDSPTWVERVGKAKSDAQFNIAEGRILALAKLNKALEMFITRNNEEVYRAPMQSLTGDIGKKWMLKEHEELQAEAETIARMREELKMAKQNHHVALNQALLADMNKDDWTVNDRPMPKQFRKDLKAKLIANEAFREIRFGGL